MTSSIDVAIIGAGPYGLSLAAHLDHQKIDCRIFGKPMAPWIDNMPSGMLLKSYPWASSLSDPHSRFTVRQYCIEQEMPYHDTLMALSIESFIAYGEAFRRRFVPNVEQKMVARLEKLAVGFRATFDDDETVTARHVILAVGAGPFKHIPDILSGLPGKFSRIVATTVRSTHCVTSRSSCSDLERRLAILPRCCTNKAPPSPCWRAARSISPPRPDAEAYSKN